MQTQAEYERNELNKALAQEKRVNAQTLRERQYAREVFRDTLASNPAIVARTVQWMLDGNYGFGVRARCVDFLTRTKKPRSRRIMLTQWAAVYEWGCPVRFATQAWKSLTDAQQREVDALVDAVIAEFVREEGAV